jgi:hypothetical protein
MRFQHNVTLLLGWMEARRLVELDDGAEINYDAEGGVAGGQVQCPRRATYTPEKATVSEPEREHYRIYCALYRMEEMFWSDD